MKRAMLATLLAASGCADGSPEGEPPVCALETRVALAARPGAVQSDGSVTVVGSVQFAPVVGDDGQQAAIERAVHAVYVAELEVQPQANEFNYRTWSVKLDADRLAAFTTTNADGSQQAALPVRAYLQGPCVLHLPVDEQPIVKLPPPEDPGAGSAAPRP